jgi:YVTN family beta-propeller protein
LIDAASTDTSQPGFQLFMSPHVNPILALGSYVYVTNTPNGTVDVLDTNTRIVVQQIEVGLEPMSLAAKPDSTELWVSNHVSDSVNVINTATDSPLLHTVTAVIDRLDLPGGEGVFDEPAGIAFASNEKAYVALSQTNQIAVIDATTYKVTRLLNVPAQDPRAIAVVGDKLLVLPFESNNQTQLSGCTSDGIDGDVCTFDAIEHVFNNNNVLSLNYTADIVRTTDLPDRDLIVYSTENEQRLQSVNHLGTLLYGLSVDASGVVYIAQTDARNAANGRAGSQQHGLAELENRPFFNQITRVDCSEPDSCLSQTRRYELEPRPPAHPAPERALATPYDLVVLPEDDALLGVAAASDTVFRMDTASGDIQGRLAVGATPRGITLRGSDEAWIYNASDSSVSVVSISSGSLELQATIALEDPTPSEIAAGRHLFESAKASSTGTFSCASCHIDGNTDQLLWVLDTPICDVPGCTQIQPRLTMPMRGLRDTAPYHWDGVMGDPHGGNNTANINGSIEPDCESGVALDCSLVLVDRTLGSTMCGVGECEDGPSGRAGKLTDEERLSLALFNLSVAFPPPPERPETNRLTPSAFQGMLQFHMEKDCGNCHRMPFLVSTNTPGTGMDAPTWRGAYDRWMILPQGRLNISDLLRILSIPDHFPEQDIWRIAGSSEKIWRMVLEGSTGHTGALGSQIALIPGQALLAPELARLSTLISAANAGTVALRASLLKLEAGDAQHLRYQNGLFTAIESGETFSNQQLLELAELGELQALITAHPPANVTALHPKPGIWPESPIARQAATLNVAELDDANRLEMRGRHIYPGARIFVDGELVDGSVNCISGELPNCVGEQIEVVLAEAPDHGGFFQLQLQNPLGKFTNDSFYFSEQVEPAAREGSVLASRGDLVDCGLPSSSWEFTEFNGSARCERSLRTIIAEIDTASQQEPWRVQVFHRTPIYKDRTYTACFSARSSLDKRIYTYLDRGADVYQLLGASQKLASNVTSEWQNFSQTWTVNRTDITSRLAFDLAETPGTVELAGITLVEGDTCDG